MPPVLPQYSRGPGASSPATFGGTPTPMNWGSQFGASLSKIFEGNNPAQKAQADLFRAQADQTYYETDHKRQQDTGGDNLSSLFTDAAQNPALASQLTQHVAETAAAHGLDPVQASKLVSLWISGAPNDTIPGVSREQMLLGGRAVTGEAPLNSDQAFDVNRAQNIFDEQDATHRYGFDQALAGDKYKANAAAGAEIGAARIKAKSDREIASQTVTTAPQPALKPLDNVKAVNSALGGTKKVPAQHDDLYRKILQRSAEIYSEGGDIDSAAAQAVDELTKGHKQSGNFWEPKTLVAIPSDAASGYTPTGPKPRSTTKTTVRGSAPLLIPPSGAIAPQGAPALPSGGTAARGGHGGAQALPPNKASLQDGQLYSTPQGPKRFDKARGVFTNP